VKQYRPALKAYTIEMPAGELKWLNLANTKCAAC
jgi:hypothetical protein